MKKDPELFDDDDHGGGSEDAYVGPLPLFDASQFELPDDFEYTEDEYGD